MKKHSPVMLMLAVLALLFVGWYLLAKHSLNSQIVRAEDLGNDTTR